MKDTYGDVTAEYRALRHRVGMVEGTHDLVWVEGPDTAKFLQGILSQDIESMEEDSVARSFLLNPQGKLTAVLWVIKGEERVGLFCDSGLGAKVVETLNYYRIRVKVEVRLDERQVASLIGPEVGGALDLPTGWTESDGVVMARCAIGNLDRALVAGQASIPDVPRVGMLAMTAVRIENGEPVMGQDVDEKTIPQETGLVPEAVSFTKGCYLGQELVARIDSRGHVNRQLRGISLAENIIPPQGAEVWFGDKKVGELTSVAESLGVMAPVGLGLIRREAEPGETVEIRWEDSTATATLHALPMV